MKLLSALVFLFPLATLAQEDCLSSVDPDTDYFPIKVSPKFSKKWDIEYFNTYKIVTNIDVNETYLLYQCGSEPPANEDLDRHAAVVEIPVRSVGIDVTPAIPFLEQLGRVDDITAFTSDPSLISSPCLLESIEAGNVLVLQTKDEVDEYSTAPESSAETVAKLKTTLGMISPFNSNPSFLTNVKISEYTEKSNAAIFEWIKFYAAFFNLEEKAQEIFAATQEHWNCVADNADQVVSSDGKKPVVLWAYYSGYCGGWDTGICPNYYCEYAPQCSAELLSSDEGEEIPKCNNAKYMSTEQLIEFGKDADYWIFPSDNWDETYTLFQDQLVAMKSVQDKQVYDFLGSGRNAWFEQRYPEYFAVLQDFCSIVGTTRSFADKSWFRNVMDPSKIGSVGECTENSRSNSILPVMGSICEDLGPIQDTTSGVFGWTTIPVVFAILVAVLL